VRPNSAGANDHSKFAPKAVLQSSICGQPALYFALAFVHGLNGRAEIEMRHSQRNPAPELDPRSCTILNFRSLYPNDWRPGFKYSKTADCLIENTYCHYWNICYLWVV
jgi:hypothetical protein